MSDEELRELEREWLQSGSEQDGAAYLSALVGTGSLAAWQLELVAELGFRPARAALDLGDPRVRGSDKAAEREWIKRLGRLDALAVRQVALALLDFTTPTAILAERYDALRTAALRCGESPTEEALRDLSEAAEALRPRHSLGGVLGGLNPTGTRDDDDVAADVRSWERSAGITIQQLGEHESFYRFVRPLVTVFSNRAASGGDEGSLYAAYSAMPRPRDPEQSLRGRLPTELVRGVGIHAWPEGSFCDPCPAEATKVEPKAAPREPLPLRRRPAPGSFLRFLEWLFG